MLRSVLLSATLLLTLPAIGQEIAATAGPAQIVHVLKYPVAIPAGAETTVRVSLYRDAAGGEAIWSEVQRVMPDASGKTVLLIGSATEGGIPQSAFAAAEARYVGATIGDGPEQSRALLAPSAYALKAADAETLGGHPASDFALAGVKARPDTATDVTQINTSSGILGGGTGPTVSLTADPTYFNTYYGQLAAANTFSASNSFSKPIVSTVATGTAPFTVASTTAVTNLNASLLGGVAVTGFPQLALQNTYASNQIIAPSAPATTATGHSSNFLWMNASVWNSSKNAAQNIGFQWRAEPLDNDTASPNANFALLSTVTSATPQETGFKITANGVITFVAAQTFPGTASTTGANTFTGNQTVSGTDTISGAAAEGGAAGAVTGQLTVTNTNGGNGLGLAVNGSQAGIFSSGLTYGLEAVGSSADNSNNISTTDTGIGIIGLGGTGVLGETTYTGTDQGGIGVFGIVPAAYAGGNAVAPVAVEGANYFTNGYGVSGTGPTAGVSGASATNGASGVIGSSTGTSGFGLSGTGATAGVFGNSSNTGIIGIGATGVSGGSSASGGAGVAGISTGSSGYGVTGSGATAGVYGSGTTAGVYGSSAASGVYGTSSGNGGAAGVYGTSTSTTTGSNNISGIGVYGYVTAAGSDGVYGTNVGGSDGSGVAGASTGAYSAGVFGSGSGQDAMGVSGSSSGYNGVGIYGTIQGGSGQLEGVEGSVTASGFTGDGVYGFVASTAGYGVRAVAGSRSKSGSFISGNSASLWADTGMADNAGYGALVATADNNYAGYFVNNSADEATLSLDNSSSASGSSVTVFAADGVDGGCSIDGLGDLTCTGQDTAIASAANSDEKLEVYAMHSSESWFEDFGSAKLEHGRVHVAIEPQFAKIVNTGVEYHVFLTAQGDCDGLYVAGKTADGFEVREMRHGTASVAFDYRIVAKRAGHEAERMQDATAALHRLTAGRDRLEARRAAHPADALPTAEQAPREARLIARVPPVVAAPVAHGPAWPTAVPLRPAATTEQKVVSPLRR